MQGLHRYAMWLALAGAITGGASVGVLLRPETPLDVDTQGLARASASGASSVSNTSSASSASSASGWVAPPGLTASDPTRAWGRSPAQSEARVLVQPGASSHADAWIVAGVLVAGAATAGLLLLRAASRRHREATDSKDFRDALKVWTELVRESAHTPRAVKRFGNKLRYFEMLQQGEERDRSLLDDLKARLRRFATRGDDAASRGSVRRAEPNRRIAAPQLVALGALYEAFGSEWLIHQLASSKSDRGRYLPPAADQVFANQLIEEHMALFSTDWPPSLEEMETFARLLDGIRMPGESEELGMSVAAGVRGSEASEVRAMSSGSGAPA